MEDDLKKIMQPKTMKNKRVVAPLRVTLFQLIFNISDGKDVESDEIGEHFWGEILERTCSVNNMNFGNIESGRKEIDCSDSEGQ